MDVATGVRLRIKWITDAYVKFHGGGNPVPFVEFEADVEAGVLRVLKR